MKGCEKRLFPGVCATSGGFYSVVGGWWLVVVVAVAGSCCFCATKRSRNERDECRCDAKKERKNEAQKVEVAVEGEEKRTKR